MTEKEVPRQLNEPTDVKLNDVKYRFQLSPFDFPQAYWTDYDEKSDVFSISFRYFGEERSKKSVESEDKKVELRIGKDSGNLYEVRIRDVRKGNPEKFSIDIKCVVSLLIKHSREARRQPDHRLPAYRNPQLLSKFIKDNASEIGKMMTTAAAL